MARVVLNKAQIAKTSRTQAGLLVAKTARAISSQATRNAPGGPYSQGSLKRSIHVEQGVSAGRATTAFVGSDLIYAHSVHEGQPARTIVPVRADKLRFFWRKVGHRVAFESVQHPGTTGQPYLTNAMRTVAPKYGFKTIRFRT